MRCYCQIVVLFAFVLNMTITIIIYNIIFNRKLILV